MIIETGVSEWLVNKLIPAFAALLGGVCLMVFWTPDKLKEKGKVVGAFVAGGGSATAGFIFTPLALRLAGLDSHNIEYLMGAGWFIGYFWVALLSWTSNWIRNRDNKEITQIIREIRKDI